MNAPRFDAVDWLARFRAAGGTVHQHGGEIVVGILMSGNPHEAQATAIMREIGDDPDRRVALRETVKAARMTRPTLSLRLPRRETNIVIEREAWGTEIDVRVIPAPEGIGHDRGFNCYRRACAYADDLSRAMSWPIVDRVGNA